MQSQQLEIIKNVGCQVRSFLENMQPDTSWCEHLSGACAVGAYITHKLLMRQNIQSSVIIGTGDCMDHCWVDIELDNNLIVLDTTATQFDKQLDVVILAPKLEYKQLAFHEDIPEERLFVTDSILFNALKDWDVDQQPKQYKQEIYDSFKIVID